MKERQQNNIHVNRLFIHSCHIFSVVSSPRKQIYFLSASCCCLHSAMTEGYFVNGLFIYSIKLGSKHVKHGKTLLHGCLKSFEYFLYLMILFWWVADLCNARI